MLYRNLGCIKEDYNLIEDELIQTEEELRMNLYELVVDNLQYNKNSYFNKEGGYGILDLKRTIDIIPIALYGSIDEIINAYEKEWKNTIVPIIE